MKKIITLLFWMALLIIGVFWHPFSPDTKNYIYQLKNFKKSDSHKQYLLLKNEQSIPIYNDMNIKGPFESVIKAHQSIETHQVGNTSGELHYLPIVRKQYAN